MFGARIRNWMETHFVRHRKKRSKDAKAKDPPAVEPAKAQSSPAICTPLIANTSHPSGHQSLSTSALCHTNPATSSSTQPTKRVTLVSPTLSCKYSYTEESTGSPRRPTLHAAINNNNNKLGARYSSYLSSPESAYSTGYSTDATSPYEPSADTLSPEYYINIRTGTRYFQSVDIDLQSKHDNLRSFTGHASQREEFATKREDCKKTSGLRSFSATPPPPPPRKSSISENAHAQNDNVRASSNLDLNCKVNQIQQKQQYCNSPRQRCRIRTNPWLSSSTTSETSICGGKEKSKGSGGVVQETTVPLTPLNEDISTAATIGSWHVADSTTTCDEESCDEDEEVFTREKPQRRRQIHASKKRSAMKKRGSFSSDSTLLSTPSISRCSSVEDATLNELGRFDESYTYDKETDILSDSDVTDCEVDDTTITSTPKTSTEQSSSITVCETELDYIDIGENCDSLSYHEGHGSYHLSYNHSEFKHLNSSAASSKLKRASQRRQQNRVESPALRANGVSSPALRSIGVESPSLRNKRVESPCLKAVESPVLRLRGVQSPALRHKRVESPALRSERIESPSLRKRVVDSPALRSKFLQENGGGSGNSTPLMRRRTPLGSNSSTPKVARKEFSTSNNSTPVRKAPADLPLIKTTEEPKSKPTPEKYSESERKLIEADKEADRKYKQLIKEAESLLVHIRNVAVEEVDLETPTVEEPARPFPQPPQPQPQPRPDPARLQIKFPKQGAAPAYPAVTVTTPSGGPPRALVTFRSVDLNSPVATETPYCPQSEPVKRKVYSSAAMQRLQDHFKLTEMDESSDSSPPEAEESCSAEQDKKSTLSPVDNGGPDERRIRRQEARNQYKLAVARKNNVVIILEEIKLNLQTQSARLHDAYRSSTDLRSPCLGDVTPSPLKANVPFGPLNIFSPIRKTSLPTKSPKHH